MSTEPPMVPLYILAGLAFLAFLYLVYRSCAEFDLDSVDVEASRIAAKKVRKKNIKALKAKMERHLERGGSQEDEKYQAVVAKLKVLQAEKKAAAAAEAKAADEEGLEAVLPTMGTVGIPMWSSDPKQALADSDG